MSDGQFGTDFFNRFSIVGGGVTPPHPPNVRPCVYMYIYVCMCVCVYVCMCVCVYVCMYVCYIYIYIYDLLRTHPVVNMWQ